MSRVEVRTDWERLKVEKLFDQISNPNSSIDLRVVLEAEIRIARSSKMNSLRSNKKRGTLG